MLTPGGLPRFKPKPSKSPKPTFTPEELELLDELLPPKPKALKQPRVRRTAKPTPKPPLLRKIQCSRCKTLGHTRRTCQAPPESEMLRDAVASIKQRIGEEALAKFAHCPTLYHRFWKFPGCATLLLGDLPSPSLEGDSFRTLYLPQLLHLTLLDGDAFVRAFARLNVLPWSTSGFDFGEAIGEARDLCYSAFPEFDRIVLLGRRTERVVKAVFQAEASNRPEHRWHTWFRLPELKAELVVTPHPSRVSGDDPSVAMAAAVFWGKLGAEQHAVCEAATREEG